MAKLKWERDGSGNYASACGRFRIFKGYKDSRIWSLYDASLGERAGPVASGTFLHCKSVANGKSL